MTFAWQFGYNIMILQVIWAIGCSMIALAALVWLPLPAIAGFGLAMICGHDLLDGIPPERFGSFGWLWILSARAELHSVAAARSGRRRSGLSAGPVDRRHGDRLRLRDRVRAGAGAARSRAPMDRAGVTVAFIVVRALNVYGDPQPWSVQPRGALYTVLSFINMSKYPPSLQYLL